MLRALRSWGEDHVLRGILKNSGYLFSSNSISAVLSAVQGILVVRLLGIEQYGLVSGVIIVFATNVNRLLSFRMSETVVKYLGDALVKGDKKQAAAVAKAAGLTEAATSVVAYLALLLLAPLASRYLAKDVQTMPLFAFYGLVLLSNIIYESSTGVLQATRRFDRLALANTGQSIITAALILFTYLTKGGIVEVLTAYLAGKTFAGVIVASSAVLQLNRELERGWWRISVKSLDDWKAKARFALSTNFNGTVNLIVRDSETLIIAFLLTKTEAGYFRLALSLINLVMMPIDPFIGPTYSEITRMIALEEWNKTRQLLKRISAIAGTWTLAAGGFLALFGWWLIPFLYKPESRPAYPATVVLLIGYGFANVLQWNRPLMLAFGDAGYPLKVTAGIGLIKTVLTFSLVSSLGYLSEAAILSGFFVLSVGIITWRGLDEMQQRISQTAKAALEERVEPSSGGQR